MRKRWDTLPAYQKGRLLVLTMLSCFLLSLLYIGYKTWPLFLTTS